MPLGEDIRGFRASIKGDTENPSEKIDIYFLHRNRFWLTHPHKNIYGAYEVFKLTHPHHHIDNAIAV